MTSIRHPTPAPIDAVITWVDGSHPDHAARRARYAAKAGPLHENASNPHRWVDSDEIQFCLQSIEAHAPWLRTIWIVVDGDGPDLSRLTQATRAKVRLAQHRDIFAGFEAHLPTFNSLSIETVLWRIEGLSEHFLYFNDDVFLTAPLQPGDVFRDGAPVLRGKWVDRSGLSARPEARADPALFNHFMQLNAALLIGADPARFFAAAHVVHPLRRSVMADLFDRFPEAFAANVSHRFRDLSQFLPQGLHSLACLAGEGAVLSTQEDHLHIRSGQWMDQPPARMEALLRSVRETGIRFLCVNDLPQLEQLLPEARSLIAAAIAPR